MLRLHVCFSIAAALCVMAGNGVLCAADDMEKPAAPPAVAIAPKADDAAKSWNGSLTIKGLGSKEGVVALMEITAGDKGEKVEWVDLWATGEAAKKLDDLASKHAKVTITGTRTADGIQVTAVGDDAKIPAAKGKKKK